MIVFLKQNIDIILCLKSYLNANAEQYYFLPSTCFET